MILPFSVAVPPHSLYCVACVLATGQGREEDLLTTFREFEYLHRKSRCEKLIGGDDISNDVITLGAYFHLFLNVCLLSRSFPLRADSRKFDSSVDREPQGNWRRIQILETKSCKPPFLFLLRRQSALENLLAGSDHGYCQGSEYVVSFFILFGFIRKDIYLFGGSNDKAKVPTPFEDVYKLSMCK